MQINELLVLAVHYSIVCLVQRALKALIELVLDLDSEVVRNVFRHRCFTVSQIAVLRREHVVVLSHDA